MLNEAELRDWEKVLKKKSELLNRMESSITIREHELIEMQQMLEEVKQNITTRESILKHQIRLLRLGVLDAHELMKQQ